MPKFKHWYKKSDPATIVSFNKDAGAEDEAFVLSDVYIHFDEMELFHIANERVVRKPQGEIDEILAAREAERQRKEAEIADAWAAGEAVEKAVDDCNDVDSLKAEVKKLARALACLVKNRAGRRL